MGKDERAGVARIGSCTQRLTRKGGLASSRTLKGAGRGSANIEIPRRVGTSKCPALFTVRLLVILMFKAQSSESIIILEHIPEGIPLIKGGAATHALPTWSKCGRISYALTGGIRTHIACWPWSPRERSRAATSSLVPPVLVTSGLGGYAT